MRFLAGRSYIQDTTFSSADSDVWTQWHEQQVDVPSSDRYPHAYRWFVHINALMRLKNAEPLVMIGGSGTNHTINDRKRRHSGESSLSLLKKEASERAARRETAPVLYTIQITFRNNNDDQAESQDSRRLWEKVKQTALPKEMRMKWGEFCTWMPSEQSDNSVILETTFVSRVSTNDPAMHGNNILRLILQSHPEDVEFCEIIGHRAL